MLRGRVMMEASHIRSLCWFQLLHVSVEQEDLHHPPQKKVIVTIAVQGADSGAVQAAD